MSEFHISCGTMSLGSQRNRLWFGKGWPTGTEQVTRRDQARKVDQVNRVASRE